MNERLQRLREHLDWVVDAPLGEAVRAEALMAEVATFFEGGPPTTEEEPDVLEARALLTLCLCPFTTRVERYLNGRLHRNSL